MSGIGLIISFVIAIVVMIVAISKFKLHPFIALMGISLILAIVVGIPLASIPNMIGAGFSGTYMMRMPRHEDGILMVSRASQQGGP